MTTNPSSDDRAITAFGYLGHELATPISMLHNDLNVALLHARKAASLLAETNPEEAARIDAVSRNMADRADESVARVRAILQMAILVNGLREPRMQMQSVAIRAVVDRAWSEILGQRGRRPDLEHHPLALDSHIDKNIAVRADEYLLVAALTNIFATILRYGMGRVTCRAWDDSETVGLEISAISGTAFVLDDSIFVPFYSPPSNASGGDLPDAGLGPYIARRIAELHGGTVRIRNDPGALSGRDKNSWNRVELTILRN